MIDLRLFFNELEGQKIKNEDKVFNITKTYPLHVKANRICENGVEIVEAFTIGDLVTQGLLKCAGQRLYAKNDVGARDAYHWKKGDKK